MGNSISDATKIRKVDTHERIGMISKQNDVFISLSPSYDKVIYFAVNEDVEEDEQMEKIQFWMRDDISTNNEAIRGKKIEGTYFKDDKPPYKGEFIYLMHPEYPIIYLFAINNSWQKNTLVHLETHEYGYDYDLDGSDGTLYSKKYNKTISQYEKIPLWVNVLNVPEQCIIVPETSTIQKTVEKTNEKIELAIVYNEHIYGESTCFIIPFHIGGILSRIEAEFRLEMENKTLDKGMFKQKLKDNDIPDDIIDKMLSIGKRVPHIELITFDVVHPWIVDKMKLYNQSMDRFRERLKERGLINKEYYGRKRDFYIACCNNMFWIDARISCNAQIYIEKYSNFRQLHENGKLSKSMFNYHLIDIRLLGYETLKMSLQGETFSYNRNQKNLTLFFFDYDEKANTKTELQIKSIVDNLFS